MMSVVSALLAVLSCMILISQQRNSIFVIVKDN